VSHSETEVQAGPVQVRGTVLTVRRVDAYYAMTVVAPAVAARFRPGQFVALAVGGDETSMLLRRAFSIHDVRPDHGGTVEFVFAVHGPGTRWLAERRGRDVLDVTGPLGRPFPVPRDPASCLLVGGGYGSAPLFALASRLRERRCTVDFLIGAASGDRVFGALTARRTGRTATITTEDGSLGVRGLVTDMLGQVIHEARTDVIYACGPMPMLRQVTALAGRYDIPVQACVEESMACGIGVCMTCVLPVIGDDGVTRMVRSCVGGPVFRGVRGNKVRGARLCEHQVARIMQKRATAVGLDPTLFAGHSCARATFRARPITVPRSRRSRITLPTRSSTPRTVMCRSATPSATIRGRGFSDPRSGLSAGDGLRPAVEADRTGGHDLDVLQNEMTDVGLRERGGAGITPRIVAGIAYRDDASQAFGNLVERDAVDVRMEPE